MLEAWNRAFGGPDLFTRDAALSQMACQMMFLEDLQLLVERGDEVGMG